ncbi:MAG TPA: hypothetical protein VLX56_03210 [Nitrososphaerales archaeon]|nr:hypothetical protein [Nitrososphaerales archaeon]
MCDCEELEYEDFETMLNVISEISRAQKKTEQAKEPVVQLVRAR